MAHSATNDSRDNGEADRFHGAGSLSVEATFKKATELHQAGDISAAMELYGRITTRFPNSPKAELARTIVAGIEKEKIDTYLNAASDARSSCNAEIALKFYNLIIREFPDRPEANSAKTEINVCSEILRSWNDAVSFQSKGDELKAIDLYRKIVERFPHSPEAENASLMMSIIRQNQFMPRGEVSQDFQEKENTPEVIVSHLLAHKKAASAGKRTASEKLDEVELQTKKIENLWQQAVALEKDGHFDEAAMLYRKIISSSSNGHRVRDAKYCFEKIAPKTSDFLRPFDRAGHWGLAARKTRTPHRVTLVALVIAGILLLVGGMLFYRSTKSISWTDIVDDAKKAIVVVRTATGAGTGFLASADGLIFTNARLVGNEKDVEVRLYSGVLKKATVVRVGSRLLDIAVLRIDGTYNHYLTLKDSEDCMEGAEIRAVGAPLGLEYFIAKGIVSHCNVDRYGVRYIQTDSAVNVGYSGGPCLNKTGEVMGMSTTISLGDEGQGVNLILPSTIIKDFLSGKLIALEERLVRQEEEEAKELDQRNKRFYADAENIYKKLQHFADTEYASYTANLDALLSKRLITYDQGQAMLEQVRYPPWGPPSMTQWIQTLALRVAKGEMPEDVAMKLIRDHYISKR